jgi:membrane protein
MSLTERLTSAIPPRFSPVIDVGVRIANAQSRQRLSLAAAGVAFWLVIAIFPATLAVITIFGLVVDPEDIADAVQRITDRAPGSLGAVLAQQAEAAAGADARNLSIGLLISLGFTLWSVSDGAYGMARAIREAYDVAPESYLAARFRAFIGAIVAVLTFGVLLLAGAAALAWLGGVAGWQRVLALAIGIPLLLVLQTAIFTGQFRYALARPTPLRQLLPGAAIGAVSIALLLLGLAIYASFAPDYQAIYGALAGIILAMLAVYFGSYALLLSAVFNAQWTVRSVGAPD